MVSGQLQRAGFIARGGQIINATPAQRNTREENAAIKQGQVPEDWNAAKRARKDCGGTWDQEAWQVVYGYKLHANTDRRCGFIRQHEVSSAHVSDSQHFETILEPDNTRRTIRADSAYADRAREAELKRHGYRADIQDKGHLPKIVRLANSRSHGWSSKAVNACARKVALFEVRFTLKKLCARFRDVSSDD